MIFENDNVIIPERYKNMSIAELRKEKEQIEKTLPKKKKSQKGSKLSKSSVRFNI